MKIFFGTQLYELIRRVGRVGKCLVWCRGEVSLGWGGRDRGGGGVGRGGWQAPSAACYVVVVAC